MLFCAVALTIIVHYTAAAHVSRWKVLSPRRNHECFIKDNKVILVGGRESDNVETCDLSTHACTVNRNATGLGNHLAVAVTPDGVINMCGFFGDEINKEYSMPYIYRILTDGTIRKLPGLKPSRGACAALPLQLDNTPGSPATACAFGGSHGTHDRSNFLSEVVCCEVLSGKCSTPFPPLPFGADHLNAVHVRAGVCEPEIEYAVVFNMRKRSYGPTSPTMYRLRLQRKNGKLLPLDPRWKLVSRVGSQAAAGVAVTPSGRFAITFGGISYDRTPPETAEINGIDLCTGHMTKWVDRLPQPLFAQVACSNGTLGVICGGCGHDSVNSEWCHTYDLTRYEQQLRNTPPASANNADATKPGPRPRKTLRRGQLVAMMHKNQLTLPRSTPTEFG